MDSHARAISALKLLQPVLYGSLLIAAMPVRAQTQAQVQAQAAAQGADTLQEVVVTAERRETDLQKTPVAVTAVSQDALVNAGVQQLDQLSKVLPDVNFNGGGNGNFVQVRGVASQDSSPTSESAVGTYVDGVALAKQRGLDGFLFDIQRIEVDKGPQGTLFGKDTNGGAINIITNKPVLGQMSGEAEVELGSYDLVRTAGHLNFPLGDTFAIRVAFQTDKHNGYFTSGFEDLNLNAGRLSALWKPTSRESFWIVADESLDTSISDNPASNIIGVEPGTTNIYVPKNIWDDQFYHGNQFSSVPQTNFRTLVNGLTAQNDYDFGFATWTTLVAHRHMNQNPNVNPGQISGASAPEIGPDGNTYLGHGYSYVPQQFTSWSVETRLTSEASTTWQWVAGLYAFQDIDGGTMIQFAGIANPPAPSIEIAQPYEKSRTYAGYAQVTYTPAALSSLHLTAGGRLNRDMKAVKGIYTRFGSIPFPYNAYLPYASHGWDASTYKGEISYDLTPTSLLYVDTATGFESGGYGYGPGVNPAVGPIYEPETIRAYEFGSKNRFLDNTLQVNLEAWYYKYKNFLGNVSLYQCNPNCGGLSVPTIESVGSATFRGVTGTINYLFTPHDQFNVSYTWQNDRYGAYIFNVAGGGNYSLVATNTPTPVTSLSNLTGTSLAGVADWNMNASYSHIFTVGDSSLTALVSSQWRGPMVLGNTVDAKYGTVIINGKTFALVDLSLQYQKAGAPWSVTAYVHNIANSLEPLAESESGSTHAISYTPYPPRLIGVMVKANLN